jgi:hypothetical protein
LSWSWPACELSVPPLFCRFAATPIGLALVVFCSVPPELIVIVGVAPLTATSPLAPQVTVPLSTMLAPFFIVSVLLPIHWPNEPVL